METKTKTCITQRLPSFEPHPEETPSRAAFGVPCESGENGALSCFQTQKLGFAREKERERVLTLIYIFSFLICGLQEVL